MEPDTAVALGAAKEINYALGWSKSLLASGRQGPVLEDHCRLLAVLAPARGLGTALPYPEMRFPHLLTAVTSHPAPALLYVCRTFKLLRYGVLIYTFIAYFLSPLAKTSTPRLPVSIMSHQPKQKLVHSRCPISPSWMKEGGEEAAPRVATLDSASVSLAVEMGPGRP